MALRHTFSSSIADSSDTTLVRPSNWNAEHQLQGVADRGILFVTGSSITGSNGSLRVEPSQSMLAQWTVDGQTTEWAYSTSWPSGSISGTAFLAPMRRPGRVLPAYISDPWDNSLIASIYTSVPFALPSQPSLTENGFCLLRANPGVAAMSSFGCTPANIGTAAGIPMAVGSYLQGIRRNRFTTSALAGNFAGNRGSTTHFAGPNVSAFYSTRFAIVNSVVSRSFAGIWTVGNPTNSDPSTNINILGFASDAADTNMQFIYNNGVGTAIKTDMGVNFPSKLSAGGNPLIYDMQFYYSPATAMVAYRIERLDDLDGELGLTIFSRPLKSGTIKITEQPDGLGLYTFHTWVGNGTTAASAIMDMMHTYFETSI